MPPNVKTNSRTMLREGLRETSSAFLPTTELFKAVCTVLEAPEDQGLKATIRESLLATTGLWKFAREQPKEGKSPEGQANILHPATSRSRVAASIFNLQDAFSCSL
jgi:hypothetical protein